MTLTPKIRSAIVATAACVVAVFVVSAVVSGVGRDGSGSTMRDALNGSQGPVPTPTETSVPVPVAVRVPILVYHNVRPTPNRALSATDKQYEMTPAEFATQMTYLDERGYETVGFADLLAAQRGETKLPEKPVIITLDDGRALQYEHALPALKEHGFVATFFVFSNAVGRDGYFSWEQLKELHASGMTIASHTRYHPYLTKIEDDDELRAELEVSKRVLEEGIGAPVELLAYPFGLLDDRVVEATRVAGYLAARGLDHRATHAPEDAHRLGSFITTANLDQLKDVLASP